MSASKDSPKSPLATNGASNKENNPVESLTSKLQTGVNLNAASQVEDQEEKEPNSGESLNSLITNTSSAIGDYSTIANTFRKLVYFI